MNSITKRDILPIVASELVSHIDCCLVSDFEGGISAVKDGAQLFVSRRSIHNLRSVVGTDAD